ncbi:unnamed protein product [Paramecium sonneborni]|uniref:Protein kinase domain-containing protein n=1 Tax=Paramecium sonneborni TaxID=65129 RepID=A0A8S1PAF0_9CILI|nr:unnamed protein product [Paramecium sonneborni]
MNQHEQQNINDDDLVISSDEEEQISKIIEYDPTGRFCKYNEEIGKGAYKNVYRGYDNESGCEVAWNVFQLMNVSENERRRAKQEIAILKSLQHKNIIRFVHSWQSKSKKELVFITEIVNGGSLKSYIRRITKPKLKVIRYWCKQILEGIEFMHSQNIIHRDLKCENIFIDTNNNELKIGDLGLSIQMQSQYTSSVLGTPEFMAPEIYNGNYNTKVDIYAFGLCILEMITGLKPFSECKGGTGQIIKKIMENQKPQSIEAIQNEKIKMIILECLKPPDERPTATQLLNQYFLSTLCDDDNSPVSINESMIVQIMNDSKNSSVLKYIPSKNVSEQKGTNNQIITNNPSNKINSNYVLQEINPNSTKQSDIKFNKLSIDTKDDYSLELQFNKCYREYYLTQNDETLLDLEQRQEKEIQLLQLIHKQQKNELQNKLSQTYRPPIIPSGSGFLSPKSFFTLFEFNSNDLQHQQIQKLTYQQQSTFTNKRTDTFSQDEDVMKKNEYKNFSISANQSQQLCKFTTDVALQQKTESIRRTIQS